MPPTLVVLEHPCQWSLNPRYLLHLLAEEWEKPGLLRVVKNYDPKNSPDGALSMLHVDLSVVPEEFVAGALRCPTTLNLRCLDIRKTRYSLNRVSRSDSYSGPVIVKSVLNSAGVPERVASYGPTAPAMFRMRNRIRLPWLPSPATIHFHTKKDYRFFPRRNQVPDSWFDQPDVLVERFLPERKGNHFVLREWYFLGDREFFNCEISRNPFFTRGTYAPDLAAPPPETIRQVRTRMRLDYGKIDYAMTEDGTAALYDVNKTIGLFQPCSPRDRTIARALAPGIHTWLPS